MTMPILANMRSRVWVLWKHYSSWFLYVIISIGSLQEYSSTISEYLPRWLLVVIAVFALIAKLVPQSQLQNPPQTQPQSEQKGL